MLRLKSKQMVWLFCRVIDNFGDMGVAWRLARLWVAHGAQVVVWCDEISTAEMLIQDEKTDHIRLMAWDGDIDAAVEAEAARCLPACVVEMFACDLPAAALALVHERHLLWLNWEYLSAEDWAQTWHGRLSLQSNGARKYFWLMGFSPESGGLLHEGQVHQHTALLAQKSGRSALLRRLRLPEDCLHDGWAQEKWFCFAYHSAIWAKWLRIWAAADVRRECWLAGHQIVESLRQAGVIADTALRDVGEVWQCGNVRLVRVAFVAQYELDAVLQLADGLIVRGEDSFVRAQLAGKPMLWHIYPQDERAHEVKLHAFWQSAYPLHAVWTQAHAVLSDTLNGVMAADEAQMAEAWQTLAAQFAAWQCDTQNRAAALLAQDNSVVRVLRRWPDLRDDDS